MKKRFILVSALLSLFAFAGAQTADFTVPSWTKYQRTIVAGTPDACVLQPKETPYSINTAINGNPAEQFGVTWFSNEGITGGKLQLVQGKADGAEDFSSPVLTFEAKETAVNNVNYNVSGNNLDDLAGFANNQKRSYVSNKVLLENLTPNTTYSYRVGGINNVWSDIYSFTTAQDSEDAFEFIYITDTQANSDEMFEISRTTVATAQANVPEAKFVLMTGDLVETSGTNNSEWEWEQWFETMKASWKNLPIAASVGNHDSSGNNNWANHFNTDNAFNEAQSDAAAQNAMAGSTYSFVYGDALFMVLNWEDYRKDETYFAAVEKWMKEQIAANTDAKWKIVAFHKNIFTGSKSHQSDSDGRAVRERMAPAFQEMGIDLVFEGHDHVYEVMGVIVAGKEGDVNTYTAVEGAVSNQTIKTGGVREDMTGIHGGTFNVNEGVLYFLNNSAGKKKYEPRTEAEMLAAETATRVPDYFQFFHRFGQTGEPTFSKVKISTDMISIVTYTVNDAGEATEFDAFDVVKTDSGDTGMADTKSVGNLKIYPNPAKDLVEIETEEAIELIRLFSMNGQELLSQKGGKSLSLSSINNGIYTLNVKTDKGMYAEQLIVQ
jgi:predicted MPP superfamily phosphohydrolase